MRRRVVAFVACLGALLGAPLAAQDRSSGGLREVNITQGSTPGWVPSEELEAEALAAWRKFNRHVDDGEFDEAYAMAGDRLKSMISVEEFRKDRLGELQKRGPLLSRKRIRVTWTKDSANVPLPGIYVAIDANSHFEKVTRHCGYTILYQAPGSDAFKVMRSQDALIEDEVFASLAEQNSPLQAELVWNVLSRSCPSYTLPPLPNSVRNEIKFASVAQARSELTSREGTDVIEESGWTFVSDERALSVWAFPPQGTPVYPSVIKRTKASSSPDAGVISMGMLCEADQTICTRLFTEMALSAGFIPLETDTAGSPDQ